MFTLELIYAWTASSLLLSWLIGFTYPFLKPWLLKLPAVFAGQVILLLTLLPLITVSLVLLLYSHPALNGYLVEDHCHGDICGPHWLFMPASSSFSSGLEIAVIGVFLLLVVIITRQSIQGHKYWTLFKGLTDKQGHLPYRIVNSERLTAWCAGLWEPEIYMTKGLVDKLSPEQLRMVWAHEHSHAVNKDNLRKSLVHWMTLHWPNKLKRTIRRDFSNQLELSCDLAAMHSVINEDGLSSQDSLLNKDSLVDVHSLEHVRDFELTISLLGKHCSRDEPLNDNNVQERVEQLRLELKKIDALSQLSVSNSWLFAIGCTLGFVLWIIIIAGALHPILESISA